jgi:hypothetical protein
MKLEVRSSKRIVEMHSDVFNKLSDDQKRSYVVLDKKDSAIASEQIVVNEVKNGKKK